MITAASSVNELPLSPQQDAPAAAGLGKDDFMQLLLASLQHQDPLNPLEPTEFSTQLAQFSSLEQLMQINDRLGAQQPNQDSSSQLFLVGLVGKEVTVQSNSIEITQGASSPLSYALDHPGLVTLRLQTAGGNTVADIVLDTETAGEHELRLEDIPALSNIPDGAYEVQLMVTDSAGISKAVVTKAVDRVTGVALGDEPLLLLAGGGSVKLGQVLEVREVSE